MEKNEFEKAVRMQLTAEENDWTDSEGMSECYNAEWTVEDTVIACKEAYKSGNPVHEAGESDGPDESMDGDHASALASAGFGTDEDYEHDFSDSGDEGFGPFE
jgi:hypothetical protein